MRKNAVGFDIRKMIMAITAIIAIVMIGKGISVQPIIEANNIKAAKIDFFQKICYS